MQYLPEKQTLMEAVVVFLASQVAPAIPDPALRFRVKIAAHLLDSHPSPLAWDSPVVRRQHRCSLSPQSHLLFHWRLWVIGFCVTMNWTPMLVSHFMVG